MRPLICLLAAGMLASAFPAHAATTAYGEAFDTLYRIDLEARTATAVGAAGRYSGVPIGNISGLTTMADGTQYAVSGALKLFLRIAPTTGVATVVGSLGLSGQGSGQYDALDLNMTAACDGTLYLSSAIANKLWTVNPQTGVATLVGPTGRAITGLVARGGTLYGAGGKGDNNLYRIDAKTGSTGLIGPFGSAVPEWINTVTMSFDAQGKLWAVLNYIPPAPGSTSNPDWSDLATIDPQTGKMAIVGPITGPSSLAGTGIKGFTLGPTQCNGSVSDPVSAPVASAWMLTLLGALLAAAGLWSVRGRLRA